VKQLTSPRVLGRWLNPWRPLDTNTQTQNKHELTCPHVNDPSCLPPPAACPRSLCSCLSHLAAAWPFIPFSCLSPLAAACSTIPSTLSPLRSQHLAFVKLFDLEAKQSLISLSLSVINSLLIRATLMKGAKGNSGGPETSPYLIQLSASAVHCSLTINLGWWLPVGRPRDGPS
jgi:hypothetical protein